MNTKKHSEKERQTYLCFHLRSERLSPACVERLTALGVECLANGAANRAFGIVDVEKEGLLEMLAEDSDVVLIERAEPPSGK